MSPPPEVIPAVGRALLLGCGGAATTWLVGSPSDVASALKKYRDLGITHFVLSDTPYMRELSRVGEQLLPLLRETAV